MTDRPAPLYVHEPHVTVEMDLVALDRVLEELDKLDVKTLRGSYGDLQNNAIKLAALVNRIEREM